MGVALVGGMFLYEYHKDATQSPRALTAAAATALATTSVALDTDMQEGLLNRECTDQLRAVYGRKSTKFFGLIGNHGSGKTTAALSAAIDTDGTPIPGVIRVLIVGPESSDIVTAIASTVARKSSIYEDLMVKHLGFYDYIVEVCREAGKKLSTSTNGKVKVPTIILEVNSRQSVDVVNEAYVIAKLLTCDESAAVVIVVLSDVFAAETPLDAGRQVRSLLAQVLFVSFV